MINALEWLYNQLRDLLFYFYDLCLQGVAGILSAIPLPSWAQNIGSLYAGLDTGIIWWADSAELGTGFAIIGSAYALRFLIRRIPFIG